MNNKLKSAVIGFAVGDALGVPIEFTRRNHGAPLKDMVGFGSHNVPAGTWSDDTSLMVAALDSIGNLGRIDYYDIMNAFISWITQAKYTATDKVFDIGIATREALSRYQYQGLEPTKCGLNGERNNGNGSLMRILPFVFFAQANNLDEEETTLLINNASSLTHAHEISKLGCRIYCDYLRSLLNGNNKQEAYESLRFIDYSKYYKKETISHYNRVLSGVLPTLREDEISSSGFVVSTLEAALWVTLRNKDFENAIIEAVNLGDDTDTVGAVAGSINGIIYGEENIPKRWTNALIRKEYLESLVDKFEKKNMLENSEEKSKNR